MSKSFKKIQEAVNSVNKLCKLLEVDDLIPLGQIVEEYYHNVLQHHGDRLATSQLKAIYNEACHYVVGQTINPSTPIWVKRTKRSNLPVFLKPFDLYLSNKEVLRKRIALSYLRVFEYVQLEPVPDLETVISPSDGAKGFESFQDEYNLFLETSHWGRTMKRLYQSESSRVRKIDSGFHYSGKTGISGPTIGNCGKQSLAINEELAINLDEIYSIFHSENIIDVIRDNQEFYKDHDDIINRNTNDVITKLGRLAFIPDKGGKTRIVAVCNYWIQESLLGLHNTLYGMLRRLRQDGTFNQTSASDVICQITSNNDVWSWDLTAATDRFPIGPQQSLLNFLDGKLHNWSNIVTSIEFYHKETPYTYKVGQPMGVYSSWAVFALTHHTIIQYLAWKEGFNTFNQYRVLGDDVAIWNKNIAERYNGILSLLDVTISHTKSIIPDNQCKPGHSAEFAKRIFYNGSELSAIPPSILTIAAHSYWSIPMLFEYLGLRQIDVESIPVSRIKDTYQLHDKQFLNLCRCFHIWSIIRRPLVKGLTLYIPEFVELVDNNMLLSLRYNELMKSAEDSLYTLMCAEEEFRDDLEEVVRDQVPNALCFFKIMKSRISNTWETMEDLASSTYSIQSDFSMTCLTKSGVPMRLSDLEFIPHLTYDEIKSDISDRTPKRVRLGKYLAKLVAKVELLVKEGPHISEVTDLF